MNLDPLVCKIIIMPNIDLFTVVEIRTAYVAMSDNTTLDKAIIRKFIYAELNKLVKRGWLNRTTSDLKGITRFRKTKLFDPSILKKTSNKNNEFISKSRINELRKQLNTSLQDCNIELLKGLGSLETYLSLWHKYPEKSKSFKGKYIAVQEHNHILEGRIRALEDILKNN